MTIHVNIGEAKTRLSELIAAVERGEEVVIARAGVPVATMTKHPDTRARIAEQRRKWIGSFKGQIPHDIDWLAPSFTDEEVDSFTLFPDERKRP